MAVNKVALSDGTVLMDLTPTTATAQDVASGKVFFTANGVQTIGSGSGVGTLIAKNIEENGTYSASNDNADGYSQVTVNVSGGGESSTIWETKFNGDKAITSSTPNYVSINDFTHQFQENETWRVTWNNTPYVFQTVYASELNAYFIGNPTIFGGPDIGSNAPFLAYNGNNYQLLIATSDTASGVSIIIEKQFVIPSSTQHT